MADGKVIIDTQLNSNGAEQGVSKLKKGLTGIGSVAKTGLSAAGKAIGVASTGIVAFGTYAIKAGANFEAGMSKVQAISGANAKEMELLTAKAKEMGAKTKFSASEAADAFSYMAMAGWKSEDMLEGIEGIMNLAAASGEDLATTSDIVTDALTAFGLSAKDSNHFADVLAQTASNANTNVGMMGETFKYVAPVAGALGYSAEDTATAISLMANSGIKASSAGTALRSIFTNLAKPSKSVATAMKDLGISLTDSSGKMKPLNKLMVEMRDKFKGLTKEQKAQYAASIAGKTGMSGLLAIVNASDKDFKKLTKSIADSNGAAQKMADTMQNNLSGQITILKSAIEGLAIEIYDSFKNEAAQFVQAGTEIISNIVTGLQNGDKKAVSTGINALMELIVKTVINATPVVVNTAVDLIGAFANGILNNVGLVGEAITVIAASIGNKITENASIVTGKLLDVLIGAINFVSSNLPDVTAFVVGLIGKIVSEILKRAPEVGLALKNLLISAFSSIGSAIPILKPVSDIFVALAKNIEVVAAVISPMIAAWLAYKATMAIIQSVTTAVTVAQTALNAVMMANPVGLVVAGVAALVVGLVALHSSIKKQTTAQQEMNKGYDEAYKKASQLSDAEKKSVENVNSLSKSYKDLSNSMKDSGKNIQVEYSHTQKLWSELKKITTENGNIKKGYESRAKVIAGELSQALGTEIKIVDGQIKGWKSLQKEIDNTIAKKKLEALISADQDKYTEAVKNQTKAYGALADANKKLEEHKKKLSKAEQDQEKAKKNLSKAQSDYNKMIERGTYYDEKIEKNYKKAAKAYGEAKGKVDGLTKSQKSLQDSVGKAQKTIDGYKTIITNYDKAMEAAASGSTKKMGKAFKNLANDFKTTKTASVKTLAEQVKETEKAYSQIKEAYKQGGAGVTKEAVKEAKNLVDKSKKELAKARSGFSAEGKNAGQGYVNGLESTPIAKAVSNFIGKGLNAMKKAQDSHSPSKKTMKLGKYAGEGYALGIESTEGLVSSAANKTFSSVLSSAEAVVDKAKTAFDDAKKAYEDVQNEISKKTGEIAKLEKKANKETGDAKKKTNSEIKKLEKELTQLKKEETEKRKALTKAQVAYEKTQLKNYYSEAAKNILELYDELNQTPNISEQFKEQISQINEDFNSFKEEHSSLMEKLQDAQTQTLEALFDEYKGYLDDVEETYEKKKSKIDEDFATTEANLSSEYNSKLTKAFDKYQKQLEDAEKEYDEKVNDISTARDNRLETVRKEYEDNCNDIIATQGNFLSELEKNYETNFSATQKLWDDKLNDLKTTYDKNIDDLVKSQEKLYNSTLNFAGLFDEVKAENVIDANKILSNAAEQTTKVEKYYNDMKKLKELNLPDEIVEQFKDMGVNAADQLEVFVNMSAEQIQQFIDEYEKRKEVSQKIVDDYYDGQEEALTTAYNSQKELLEKQRDEELEALTKHYDEEKKIIETKQAELLQEAYDRYDFQTKVAKSYYDQQLTNAEDFYKKEIKDIEDSHELEEKAINKWYEKQWYLEYDRWQKMTALLEDEKKKELDGIRAEYEEKKTETIKQFERMIAEEEASFSAGMQRFRDLANSKAREIGNAIKDGLINGSSMTASEAQNVANNITDKLLADVKKNLDIHSPSGVFKTIGEMCLRGFEKPFENYNPVSAMEPSINKVMNSTNAGAITTQSSVTNNTTTNAPTLNFYDSAVSPDAVYRQFNKTMRYGLAGGIA